MAYMYILECADGTYYVGSTKHLEARIAQHQDGSGAAYTRRRRPVRLVYYEHSDSIAAMYAREKQVQGWSHAKRAALIRGDFDEIRRLARESRGDLGGRSSSDRPSRSSSDRPSRSSSEPER